MIDSAICRKSHQFIFKNRLKSFNANINRALTLSLGKFILNRTPLNLFRQSNPQKNNYLQIRIFRNGMMNDHTRK